MAQARRQTGGTVCFYSVATHLGGGERSMLDLVRRMNSGSSLYRPMVIVPAGEGPLLDVLREEGLSHSVLKMPRNILGISRGEPIRALIRLFTAIPRLAIYLFRLRALLQRIGPALVHSNGLKCHVISALVCPVTGIPVLWHLRDIYSAGPVLTALRGLARQSKVFLVANSAATCRSFDARSTRLSVAHNGLDPVAFNRPKNRQYHLKFGVSDSLSVIGIIGVLARWKGQVEFLRMAQRLLRDGRDLRFVVIGGEIYDTDTDRGYGEFLLEEARQLQISDNVYFAGYQKDPVAALKGLDVLVHASIRPEPFGRVIIEGMAAQIPVVAAAAGGVTEIIENEVSGLLYDPGDVDGMADCVARILDNSDLGDSLAARGRERFQSHFTLEHHFQSITRIYDRVSSS